MIKASGRSGDGTPLLLLGLSGENMARLMAGEPIRVDTAAMGLPKMDVIIVGGRTEDSITEDLRAHGLVQAALPRPV